MTALLACVFDGKVRRPRPFMPFLNLFVMSFGKRMVECRKEKR